jgi:hypothetical protein
LDHGQDQASFAAIQATSHRIRQGVCKLGAFGGGLFRVRPQTLVYWIVPPPQDRSARAAMLADADTSDPLALKLQHNAAREWIRVLEMEKKILRKATAFFAKENG